MPDRPTAPRRRTPRQALSDSEARPGPAASGCRAQRGSGRSRRQTDNQANKQVYFFSLREVLSFTLPGKLKLKCDPPPEVGVEAEKQRNGSQILEPKRAST